MPGCCGFCFGLRSTPATPAKLVGAISQRVSDGHQELHPLRALTSRSCVGWYQTATCIAVHDFSFDHASCRELVSVVLWIRFPLAVRWNGGTLYNTES